jgi:hypothetical protein
VAIVCAVAIIVIILNIACQAALRAK